MLLLDDQSATFGLLDCQNGLAGIVVPGLLGTDLVALLGKPFLYGVQRVGVAVGLGAYQQVQVGVGDVGDLPGLGQGQVDGVVWVHYH
ncbi:hypothetical protein D3C78_1715350 [compost metagenome]